MRRSMMLDSALTCPCCGDVAAEGVARDEQALLCGCAGSVSVEDAETDPYVILEPFAECPSTARCREAGR